MNPDLLALLIHDIKNELGTLEAELDLLQSQPSQEAAHRAHQRCALLRQRLVAYLTLYAAPDRVPAAHLSDESPRDFLASLLHVASRPDAAPLRVGPCRSAPPFWYFDPRLVRLALEAALHNAWRFARSDVVLDARTEDGQLVFSVDDDGPGLGAIDPEAASSTGLGMELCAAVARAHAPHTGEGRVMLIPRAEGGVRFEMWLP